jgi:hypothetical protein
MIKKAKSTMVKSRLMIFTALAPPEHFSQRHNSVTRRRLALAGKTSNGTALIWK